MGHINSTSNCSGHQNSMYIKEVNDNESNSPTTYVCEVQIGIWIILKEVIEMKVKEFIELLQRYSPELSEREICFSTSETDYTNVGDISAATPDYLIIDLMEE